MVSYVVRTVTAQLSHHLIARSSMPSISQVFTSDETLPFCRMTLIFDNNTQPFNLLERTVPTTAIH